MYCITGESWNVRVTESGWSLVSHCGKIESTVRNVSRLYDRRRLTRFVNKYRKLHISEAIEQLGPWVVSEIVGYDWSFVRCGNTIYFYGKRGTILEQGVCPPNKIDVLSTSMARRRDYPMEHVRGIITNFIN